MIHIKFPLPVFKVALCLHIPTLSTIKQASLEADIKERRKIQDEAEQGVRARSARDSSSGGRKRDGGKKTETALSTHIVNITSGSLKAMQARALRVFQRSMTCLQVLTDEDFRQVADLEELAELTAAVTGPTDDATPSTGSIGDGDVDNHESLRGKEEEEANPTPSLSSARHAEAEAEQQVDTADRGNECGGIATDERGAGVPNPSAVSMSVLRVLRAAVVVLGGCGLGPLPSDKDLWRAVRAMLLDGSLRHRMRHFDRCVLAEQTT